MKSFFFDLDDTLYDQFLPFLKAFNVRLPHFSQLPIFDVYKSSRKYSDFLFEKTEAGILPLKDMQNYRIRKALEDHGVSITDNEASDFQKEYQRQQYRIDLPIEMEDLFKNLQSKPVKSFILTNGPRDHQMHKINALGIVKWFSEEQIFISGALALAKPNEKLFKLVEKKTRSAPGNCWMIGDSWTNDIAGARAAGWNAIWLNKRNEKKQLDKQTVEVKNYEELTAVLKELDD